MRSLLLISLLLPTLSCAESRESPSKTQSFSSSDRYVVDKKFGFADLLDKRLSLISKSSDRAMFLLLGDDEPVLMALGAPQHLYKIDGSRYEYLDPKKVLLFTIGPKIYSNSYDYSELFIYNSDTAVGYVYYGNSGGYPYNPYSVSQLCTGSYEAVCTISFDPENAKFDLKLN